MAATSEMSTVRITIEMLIPSTPTKYSMLNCLIQTKWWTYCTPPFPSNLVHSQTPRIRFTVDAASATMRAPCLTNASPKPAKCRRAMRPKITATPIIGVKVIQVSR